MSDAVEKAFETLKSVFRKGVFQKETTYYFHIGDVQKSITISGESFKVENGKTNDHADCFAKMSGEFFHKIWDEGYMPQLKDFMTGEIKSNNPMLLKTFFEAFHTQK